MHLTLYWLTRDRRSLSSSERLFAWDALCEMPHFCNRYRVCFRFFSSWDGFFWTFYSFDCQNSGFTISFSSYFFCQHVPYILYQLHHLTFYGRHSPGSSTFILQGLRAYTLLLTVSSHYQVLTSEQGIHVLRTWSS